MNIYTNFRSPDFLKESQINDEFYGDGKKYRITNVDRTDKEIGFILITCKRIKANGDLGVSGFDVTTHKNGITKLKEFRK